MTFETAVSLDMMRDIQGAARAYESLLEHNPSSAEGAVNLMVLYWQATEYGFSAASNLPIDFIAHAGTRLHQLLSNVAAPIRMAPQYIFWERYIRWADFGGDLNIEMCLEWLRLSPDYLEPVMFVFSATAGEEMAGEADALLRECERVGTVRGSYVASVIMGVKKRVRGAAFKRPD